MANELDEYGITNNYSSGWKGNVSELPKLNIPYSVSNVTPVNVGNGLTQAGYVAPDVLGNMGYDTSALITPDMLNTLETAKLGTANTNWMTPFGGYQGVAAGTGLANFGLGLASYLDQKPLMKKQKELMGQQIEQNRFLIDQAKGRQKDISGAFGGGLANKYVG